MVIDLCSMVSIVIRNKNEATALEKVLRILHSQYRDDFAEVVVVDNNSTDNSLQIAQNYGCKIVPINDFTYGKATNLGIQNASSNCILLLSAHAIPVGNSFFKDSIAIMQANANIAGLRYINSLDNYARAIENNFVINNPIQFGLMTACAMINKTVWEEVKFDEEMVFSEDKDWSKRVVEAGFLLKDINQTFFYFAKPTQKGLINRYKNETIAQYQLKNQIGPSIGKIILSFLKKIMVTNVVTFFATFKKDVTVLKTKFEIRNRLKSYAKNK